VVEIAHTTASGEPLLPEPVELQLSQLVGQPLRRYCRVPVGLAGGEPFVAAAGQQGRPCPSLASSTPLSVSRPWSLRKELSPSAVTSSACTRTPVASAPGGGLSA